VKRPSARWRTILQYLAVAAGGFLAAYVFVAFVILPDDVALGDVTVPGVINLTQGDAQRRLTALGLTVAVGESRYSPDAPKSTVLLQTPAAGTVVAPGSSVTLDVSAGQQRATIPSLTGLSRADAERALSKAGLALGQVREEASDSARGLVLDARPSEGQVVPLGTRVDLAVSGGPAELTMPDVVGRDLGSARTLIAQLGLATAPEEYDPNSTLPAGTVVAQSPAAGSSVAAGTSVALRVAGNP
jgi:serine/threonine-protein kinase